MTIVGSSFAFDRSKNLRTDLEFQGSFTSAAGATNDVQPLRMRPHLQDSNTLVVTNFGPFGNPFATSGDEIGTFRGTVTAINTTVHPDGRGDEARSQPLWVVFDIKPSIVIRDFRPLDNTDASCGPVKRLLGGFFYQMTVTAVGFKPVNFSYTVSGEPGILQPRIVRAEPVGQDATFGTDTLRLFFEPVPQDLSFYAATVNLEAIADDGQVYASRYVFGVHNPIEFIRTGSAAQGEVYAPARVSDCYAGGLNGSSQTWTESVEESQQRGTTQTWDRSYTKGHSTSTSSTHTNSVNMQVMDSTTAGWSAGWNSSVSNTSEVGMSLGWNAGLTIDAAPFGIGGQASGGLMGSNSTSNSVTGSYGTNFEQNRSDTHSTTVGHDYSVSDTEQYSYEESQSVTNGQQFSWTVSTAHTTTHSTEVMVLPGMQAAVYRQRVRVVYPSVIVAYDLCGNSQVVARGEFTDWTWSLQVEQGSTCPPPPTHMPPAKCFLDCGGN